MEAASTMQLANPIFQPRTGPTGLSRRELLFRAGNGFGGLALAAMLAEDAATSGRSVDSMLVRAPHFEPKA